MIGTGKALVGAGMVAFAAVASSHAQQAPQSGGMPTAPTGGQAGGQAGGPTGGQTVQQAFEAAKMLDEGADKAGALAAWERLELRTKPASRNRAIVLIRKAGTLLALDRSDDAVAAARAGLAILPASDATLAEDRWKAYYILGQIAAHAIDYASASDAFAQAEHATSDATYRMGALLAYVQTATFIDPPGAAAALGRMDALAATAKVDSSIAADIARRHALLLMNQGDLKGARTYALSAVKYLGGLTEKTDTQDVSARSDVAIIMLLSGASDNARDYMAMTGAGRLSKGSFEPAAGMQPPDCGGEAGLKPEDVAVVEFSIGPDGTVIHAVPIYAAGGGKVALEFARTARSWSWSADEVKAIPVFFRYHARVEMRCSTAFPRPSIDDGLDAAFQRWIAAKGTPIVMPADGLPAATTLIAQRAALALADAQSTSSVATLAALYSVARNRASGQQAVMALMTRALAIAVDNGAPPEARLALDLPLRKARIADWFKPGAFFREISPMLAEPVYATDPQTRAVLRLVLADNQDGGIHPMNDDDRRATWLRQVADDPALKPNDPLRVGALIRIASIEERNGRAAAARAAFERTGLSANQCAIMDSSPKMTSMPGSEAFPIEAIRWGFEGWTKVQYDVDADGHVVNTRALLSYPPFIFTKAGTAFIDKVKFEKTYRPDGGLGCGATARQIRFILPKSR